MQLCEDHHGKLIEALYNRGLSKWMPDSPLEAREKWSVIRATAFGKDTYEPTFFSAFSIMFNAQQMGGVNTSEGDDVCPICGGTSRDNWIENSAEDAFKEAERLGLKPKRLIP